MIAKRTCSKAKLLEWELAQQEAQLTEAELTKHWQKELERQELWPGLRRVTFLYFHCMRLRKADRMGSCTAGGAVDRGTEAVAE